MTINVQVVVSQMPDKSTNADVRTDVRVERIRDELVAALDLGTAINWDLAVIPANKGLTLNQYTPADGDTFLLIEQSDSQGPAVKLKTKS